MCATRGLLTRHKRPLTCPYKKFPTAIYNTVASISNVTLTTTSFISSFETGLMVSLRLTVPNGFLFLFFLIRTSLQASLKGKLRSVGL